MRIRETKVSPIIDGVTTMPRLSANCVNCRPIGVHRHVRFCISADIAFECVHVHMRVGVRTCYGDLLFFYEPCLLRVDGVELTQQI